MTGLAQQESSTSRLNRSIGTEQDGLLYFLPIVPVGAAAAENRASRGARPKRRLTSSAERSGHSAQSQTAPDHVFFAVATPNARRARVRDRRAPHDRQRPETARRADHNVVQRTSGRRRAVRQTLMVTVPEAARSPDTAALTEIK